MIGKSRIGTAAVFALYLSAAAVFGMVHVHRWDTGVQDADHCPACSWHVASVSDVPLAFSLPSPTPVLSPLERDNSATYSVPTLRFFSSRAPPAAA